ncbi:MAG TPA: hypothetical protein VIK81_01120 [Patescibacteria group bacterium]
MVVDQAIMQTIVYSDIFSYPLTLVEIHQFLIEKSISKKLLKKHLSKLVSEAKIENLGVFFFLPKREKIVDVRIKRQKITRPKILVAKKFAGLISKIPSVIMIGLTGALAVGNSDSKDDIDFFIVCQSNTVWLTRFLVTVVLTLLGQRRLPNSKKNKDKICLNMFIDQNSLKFKQSLYMAHEIAQLKPLFDRGIYRQIWTKNKWVFKYLPNFKQLQHKDLPTIRYRFEFHDLTFIIWEKLLKSFQILYMKRRRTIEEISDSIIRFHPNDASIWVEREFQKRLAVL